MLAPRGKEARQADKDGRATVVVGQVAAAEACASLVFEVVEADGCTNSRLGALPCKLRDASLQTCAQVATPHDSLSGTPAELWPHPPPAPPAAAGAAAKGEARAQAEAKLDGKAGGEGSGQRREGDGGGAQGGGRRRAGVRGGARRPSIAATAPSAAAVPSARTRRRSRRSPRRKDTAPPGYFGRR